MGDCGRSRILLEGTWHYKSRYASREVADRVGLLAAAGNLRRRVGGRRNKMSRPASSPKISCQ